MKKITRWAERSLLRYVLTVGVVFWGTFTAILVTLIEFPTGETRSLAHVCTTFIGFWVCGIFFGLAMWYIVVRKRKQAENADETTDARNER
jgi:hypothetical protein